MFLLMFVFPGEIDVDTAAAAAEADDPKGLNAISLKPEWKRKRKSVHVVVRVTAASGLVSLVQPPCHFLYQFYHHSWGS